MATETVTPSKTPDIGVKRAQIILNEIATIAGRTSGLCALTHADMATSRNVTAMELQLDNLWDVVRRIGLLADIASDEIGGDVAFGTGIEDWLLPPGYPATAKV
jgi:hypothetical protein